MANDKLIEGRKKAYLSRNIKYNGELMTQKEWLDTLIKEGRNPIIKEVVDTAKKNQILSDWEHIKNIYPFGNTSHPQTIEALRLKKIINTEDYPKKNEYRAMAEDDSFSVLDKFGYEYMVDVLSDNKEKTDDSDVYAYMKDRENKKKFYELSKGKVWGITDDITDYVFNYFNSIKKDDHPLVYSVGIDEEGDYNVAVGFIDDEVIVIGDRDNSKIKSGNKVFKSVEDAIVYLDELVQIHNMPNDYSDEAKLKIKELKELGIANAEELYFESLAKAEKQKVTPALRKKLNKYINEAINLKGSNVKEVGIYDGDFVDELMKKYGEFPEGLLVDIDGDGTYFLKFNASTGNFEVSATVYPKKTEMKHLDYKKAIQLPKGGAVKMDKDNLTAQASEMISSKQGTRPEAIYNWANKHNVDLVKFGYVLADIKNNDELLEDVLNDKFDAVKMLIEKKENDRKDKKTSMTRKEKRDEISKEYNLSNEEVNEFMRIASVIKFYDKPTEIKDVSFANILLSKDLVVKENGKYFLTEKGTELAKIYFNINDNEVKEVDEVIEKPYAPQSKFKSGDLVKFNTSNIDDSSVDVDNVKIEYNTHYGYIVKPNKYVIDSTRWKPHWTYDVKDFYDGDIVYKDIMEGRISLTDTDKIQHEVDEAKIEGGTAELLTKEEADKLSEKYINLIRGDFNNKSNTLHDWFGEVICRYPKLLMEWQSIQLDFMPKKEQELLEYLYNDGLPNLKQFFNSLMKYNVGKKELIGIYELISERLVNDKLPKKVDFKIDPNDKGLSDVFKKIVSDDDLRPLLTGIEFDNYGVVGTDAHKLLFISGKATKKGTFHIGKQIGVKIDGKYPLYQRVIPIQVIDGSIVTLDRKKVESMYSSLKTIKNSKCYNVNTGAFSFSLYKGEGTWYNIENVIYLLDAWLKVGFDKLEFSYKTKTNGQNNVLVIAPNIKEFTKFKGSGSIVMAIMKGGQFDGSTQSPILQTELYMDVTSGKAETAGITDDLYSEFNLALGTEGAIEEKEQIEELESLIELLKEVVAENPKDLDSVDALELYEETLVELKKVNDSKLSNVDLDARLSHFSKTNPEIISLQKLADKSFKEKEDLEKQRLAIIKKGGDTSSIDKKIEDVKKEMNEAHDKTISLLKEESSKFEKGGKVGCGCQHSFEKGGSVASRTDKLIPKYQVYYYDNDGQKVVVDKNLLYHAAVKLSQKNYSDGLSTKYEVMNKFKEGGEIMDMQTLNSFHDWLRFESENADSHDEALNILRYASNTAEDNYLRMVYPRHKEQFDTYIKENPNAFYEYKNGGSLENTHASIIPNLLIELWLAVHEKRTDDYGSISEKLDANKVPFSVQNKVSESATEMRYKKAIDVLEVKDIVGKILSDYLNKEAENILRVGKIETDIRNEKDNTRTIIVEIKPYKEYALIVKKNGNVIKLARGQNELSLLLNKDKFENGGAVMSNDFELINSGGKNQTEINTRELINSMIKEYGRKGTEDRLRYNLTGKNPYYKFNEIKDTYISSIVNNEFENGGSIGYKPLYYATYNDNNIGLLLLDTNGNMAFEILHASVLRGSSYSSLGNNIPISGYNLKNIKKASEKDFDIYRVSLPPDFHKLNNPDSLKEMINKGDIVTFKCGENDTQCRGEVLDVISKDEFLVSKGIKSFMVSKDKIVVIAPAKINTIFERDLSIYDERVMSINSIGFFHAYEVGTNPFEVNYDSGNIYGYGIYFNDDKEFGKSKSSNSRTIKITPNIKKPLIFLNDDGSHTNSQYSEAYLKAVEHDGIKDENEFNRKMVELGYDSLVIVDINGIHLILLFNDPNMYTLKSDIAN